MKRQKIHNYRPHRRLLFFSAALLLLSIACSYYFGSKPSTTFQQNSLQRYVTKQQQDAGVLLTDTALMRKLVLQSESLAEFKKVEEKGYGLFLFAETVPGSADPLFWNNQKILPPKADFSLADGIYFQQLLNGYYVMQKKALRLSGMNNHIVAYVLIPVLNKYYLPTGYLPTEFVHDKEAVNQISIAGEKTEFPIRSIGGGDLFYIKKLAYGNEATTNIITVLLRLSALILLLVYVQLTAEWCNRNYGLTKAIVFLTAVLLAVRVALFVWPQLLSLRQFPLFDPSVYASNTLNRSLGDLLLNAICACWIVLFAWFSLGPKKRLPPFVKGIGIPISGVGCILLLLISTFELANVVNYLITNSKISFIVTDFFSLDVYSIYGFIVLALLALFYYYFSRLLFLIIRVAFPNLIYLYFAIAVTGLTFLTLRSGNAIVLFHLPVLAWLIIYTLLVSREGFVINRFRITSAGILFWIFIFSGSLALLILKGNREKEVVTRKGIAEKYDQLTDPSRERPLSIAATYLDNRYLKTAFPRFYSESQSHKIRDSIITEFAFYGNPYAVEIYVFDAANHPVNNGGSRSFAELNTLTAIQSRPTGIPDLYYIETSYDKFTYILKRAITDTTAFTGSLFILATPKQYQGMDSPYPEIFRQVNHNDPSNSPFYSYAIYKEQLLRNHSSKYSFPITITDDQVPVNEIVYRDHTDESGSYDELWYRANNKKMVVVARKKDSLIESITLFSYLFCAFLFMVGLLRVFEFLLSLIRNRKTIGFFSRVNIRTQIHGTIIFISVLSFVVIGIATISFFISRYNRNNIDRISRTADVTASEMEKRAADAGMLNAGFTFYDSASRARMQNLVREIADVHDVYANIYDLRGNLQISSDNEVYSRGVLSTKMHPMAYYRLKNLREVQTVQDEYLSSLKYLSMYTTIRDKEGKMYAYLNIPYFSSESDLKQEISNFFVTIVNLNAFIFLLAGVIALFITNRITRSFSVIGNKMKEITMGKTAEEIVWNKDDEIGELVKQYNRMVHQLEQSGEALVKSEREGAWREMARQVAHEIKNPLTPMKLSIQYLQKAIQNNQPNVQQLTTNVATTLIEQIDHLSKIAADFSQFANIGNKKVETMDLHGVLGSLVDLYAANPTIKLLWNKAGGDLMMYTDKTHMNRLFTNLLSNAVDACSESRKCIITISEEVHDGIAVISVTDNGEGIPPEMQSKIFMPNFTTKTSGTGLGLAMCKSIAEQAGGSIWFQTREEKGTTFFVRLPLVS